MPSNTLRERTIRLAHTRPGPLRRALIAAMFPSAYDIGDPVWVTVQGQRLAGNVRQVSFTTGKVRYGVQVQDVAGPSTLWDLDSVLVQPRPDGVKLQYGLDTRP